MATIQSPLQRCNAVLRALGARYRLREHRRSPWLTVYQLCPGGKTREVAVHGYAASDPAAVASLQELLIDATRTGNPLVLPDRRAVASGHQAQPCWPEICEAVVAFQRRQGVNMNLAGPFKGKGYFCLLPVDQPATEEDVRRFAVHTSESLKARLEDPAEPLIPMATHRQGFRQKREVVSLLRRAGFGAIAPQALSEELKKSVKGHDKISNSHLVLTFAAMHRLSELSRYDPILFSGHFKVNHNWLLSEFINSAPNQFIYGIASEITGLEFIRPDAF